jgi:hypothetical protein
MDEISFPKNIEAEFVRDFKGLSKLNHALKAFGSAGFKKSNSGSVR